MNLENNYILNLLKQTGNEIYLVGGVVRDIYLNRPNHDKDIIVVDMPAKDFAQKFADDNNASFVTLDEENNIYRVVMEDKINYVDITNPINNSLEDDLRRRDLTINSVAIRLSDKKVVDLVGGLDDIKNGIVKAVSEENIVDDPLRILRAYRFASTLGFEIENDTLTIIKRHIDKVLNPAVERRNVEIIKLFGGKYAHKVLEQMDNIGLLDLIFPILDEVKKVPPNTHHHLDLFHHSLATVEELQNLYETSCDEVKEHLESVDFGGDTRLAHLKLAGFLHDIGKFSTWTIEGDRHRFIMHDEVGSELAKKIFKVEKYSKKQIDYIQFIIRHHIYPSSVISAPNMNDKIYMRYVRKADDCAIDLVMIAKADRLTARGPAITDEMVNENISGLDKLLLFYLDVKPRLKPLPKLLTGDEIMELKNIKPSKALGEIVSALHEAQLDGDVQTKEEAVKFVLAFNLQP